MRNFSTIKSKLKYKPKYIKVDLNDGEEPIKIISNPSENTKEEIIEIIIKNFTDKNNKTLSFNLINYDVFIPIVQIITDISFANIEEGNMFINYLFEEPSDEAIKLREEILKVVNKILDDYITIMKDINNINPEEMREILSID